ncbi:hypothetical protein FOA52_000221 [Chlamydomonas sp. UWO 241]|nr:hypothetical protein FOA52_000221 [Chlamydomonas sp. UWO 241]
MPPRRDVLNLVRNLGANARPSQQRQAVATLLSLCCIAIFTAGAIPLLVQLLKPGPAAELQQDAAGALSALGRNAGNAVTIAAAGAIPLLMQLLGPAAPARLQQNATLALKQLAANADNVVAIAAAGAIPPLVQLLGPGSLSDVKLTVVGLVWRLSRNAENASTIAAAGAIPLLVLLLGHHCCCLGARGADQRSGRFGHTRNQRCHRGHHH